MLLAIFKLLCLEAPAEAYPADGNDFLSYLARVPPAAAYIEKGVITK